LPRGSVILGYHGVGASSLLDDPYLLRVRPDRLRAQIETLLAAGLEFVTMAQFAAQISADDHAPAGYAVVTFDDGMQDNHLLALPILSEYGLRATVYVLAGAIGQPNPWTSGRMLDASELRDLVAAGWDMGAHSMTHPHMATLTYNECLREMVESRQTVERVTGATVATFAYPFGSHGPAATAAARDAGFAAAVCMADADGGRYSLRRAMINAGDGSPIAILKAAANYDPRLSSGPLTSARRAVGAWRAGRTARRSRAVRDGGMPASGGGAAAGDTPDDRHRAPGAST
jgi:peptidoglycan/xylan/chitin deacetylase (PgdA/CDA1 family)